MSIVLDLSLLVLGAIVLLWGFERYRTRFVKADLIIAGPIGTGLILLAVFPVVFDQIGAVLSIPSRFTTVSLIANATLLSLVLSLITKIRETRSDVSELTRNLSISQATEAATEGSSRDFIGVIIPAYNESDTVRSVVTSLPERVLGYEVQPIVVSDGSVDDTAQQAQVDDAVVVEHPLNQGQGGALKTGFEIACQRDASIVITMDADGQHPTDKLEELVQPIIDDEADYVMGSRYRGVDRSGNGVVRQSGIRAFTWIINRLTKSSITDCTNGYRAIRGPEVQKLTLTEERFSAPELIIEARKNCLRIEEIPVVINEREAGETKKPRLGYAVGLARTIFVTWAR